MPNLIKLYTRHGAIWVDTAELSARGNKQGSRCCVYIYTSRGNRLVDTAAFQRESYQTRPSGLVHEANLFATPELAKADSDRIYADMARRGNMETVRSI